MDPLDRVRDAIQEDDNGCWIWTHSKTRGGYGQVLYAGKNHRVHRLMYSVFVGPIPTDLQLDHLCRVRACCNPEHLEPVTNRENQLRSPLTLASANALKTHCPHGHPYTAENTYTRPSGSRECRTCRRPNLARRRVRLNVIAVRVLRHLYASGRTATELAAAYRVDTSTAADAIRGRTWGPV